MYYTASKNHQTDAYRFWVDLTFGKGAISARVALGHYTFLASVGLK